MSDFYAEDEPVEDVIAAYEAGEKGLTAPPSEQSLYACPGCGAPTTPQRTIHPSYCLPCTETDIGMTYVELRARISAVLNKGRNRKWNR